MISFIVEQRIQEAPARRGGGGGGGDGRQKVGAGKQVK